MHNRDLIWKKADRSEVKIKDMSNSHLTNTLNILKRDFRNFAITIGKKKTQESIKTIKQEIRFRKINRINSKNDEENDELF